MRGYLSKSFLDNVFRLVQKTGAKKVLDAGCGEGYVIERLKEDVSAEFLGLDIENIYQIPFEDKSFDLVILSEVLEHLEDPVKALCEVKRVANKYALISVPHEPIWRFGNMARLKYMRTFGNNPKHINHWTRRAFMGLVSNHFDIKEIKSPFPWTIALCQKKEMNWKPKYR